MSMTSSVTDAPRPIETAPSAVVAEAATTARLVGTAGLFFLVLGAFAVGAHRIFSSPRMISEGTGFLCVAFGLTLMLYHAARDTEIEMRRLYGVFSFLVLGVALGAALVPGPVFSKAVSTEMGSNLPWGIALGVIGLLFLAMFARNETEEPYANIARFALLGIGGVLVVGMTLTGFVRPNFLAGPGLAVALLGLGFLCAYLGNTDTTDGLGYNVAFLLGIFGGVVAFIALGKAAFPVVLYEGPQLLRKPTGALDAWQVIARVLGIVAFLAPVVIAYFRKSERWLVLTLGVFGLVGAGVLVAGSVSKVLNEPPEPFLIPGGVVLMALGLAYLAAAVSVCSDNTFVTLTRREFGAYFFSPIGYLVLGCMAAAEWEGYMEFISRISRSGGPFGQTRPIPEPIVEGYIFALFPVLALTLEIPALTMRLLSEEKRTGSLEMLLTAPVQETAVVFSKFFATWIFFLLTWVPAGLFLIALRIEAGQTFDYRPLLSFYLSLAACGAAFVAIGLFFSSLSANQIITAVVMCLVMLMFLLFFFIKQVAFFGATLQSLMKRLSYLDQWTEALSGQLPIRDVFVWASLAVFFLFLTVKGLETRRWK